MCAGASCTKTRGYFAQSGVAQKANSSGKLNPSYSPQASAWDEVEIPATISMVFKLILRKSSNVYFIPTHEGEQDILASGRLGNKYELFVTRDCWNGFQKTNGCRSI